MLAVTGAVGATFGDWTHVLTHTLSYPPDRFRWYLGAQPFWVPLLFASATIVMGTSTVVIDRFRKRPAWGAQTWPRAWCGLSVVLLLHVLSGVLPPGASHAVVWGGGIAALVVFDRTRVGVIFAVLVAIGGTAVEATLCLLGAFAYAPALREMGVVPAWLPAIYIAASAGVGNFARLLLAG